jgi:cytochrome c556
MKGIVESRGDPRAAVPRVDDMLAWYRGMPALFPPGSDRGDTRALPALWSDRGGFETVNADMVRQQETLRAAADNGDPARFGQEFTRRTGQTCGTCHRPYRQRI